jgi:hypothetical protein
MPQGASSLPGARGSVGCEGRFVRDEASQAQRRHTYFPVAHFLTYLEYFC